MKPPLNHMMLNQDTLADELDAIVGYRTSHAGLVLPGSYTQNRVEFDGTNDGLTKTSGIESGVPSSGEFTFSCWLNFGSTVNNARVFQFMDSASVAGGGGYVPLFRCTRVTGGKLAFAMWSETDADYEWAQNSALTGLALSNNTWYHVHVVWEKTAGGEVRINGSDTDGLTVGFGFGNDLRFDLGDQMQIGIGQNGNNKAFVRLADVWFHTGVNIPYTTFYNGGTPPDLGSTGATGTGVQPLVYYSGAASVWNAGTNKGSIGNFTMTGAVTDV